MIWLFTLALFAGAQGTSTEKLPSRSDVTSETSTQSEPTRLENVSILDSRERLDQVSASQTVGSQVIQNQKIQDVNRALKQVPGVQIQEEDAMGLRPNIGLRGTNPHRSRKIVILEDGILIGPAPYSAPAAYYTPSMLHTSNLEVMKGLAALPYGPNSIGGAINYRTRPIPLKNEGRVQVSGGSFGQQLTLIEGGGVTRGGLSGVLNASNAKSKGFKKLPFEKDTGFKKNDVLLKAEYELPGASNQAKVGFKAGYADEVSDETYLGLTSSDFGSDPNQRYAASEMDQMRWKHTRLQFDYGQSLGAGTAKASIYRHDFHRNWSRLNGFRDNTIRIDSVLQNPEQNRPHYLVLTGQEDSASLGTGGDLDVANNDRFFFSQGLQTELWQNYKIGRFEHQTTLTAKLHQDQIERRHTKDFYSMEQGRMSRVTANSLPDTQNRHTASVRALGVQHEAMLERWRFQVMARAEDVDYEVTDFTTGASTKKSTGGFAPGVGLAYRLSPNWTTGATVARGLTLVGTNATDDEDPEESVNYEVFSRYLNEDQDLQADLAGFYNDYRNIKGTASFSSGATNENLDNEYSGGRAQVVGVEGRIAKRFQAGPVGIPVRSNLTWISARFAQDSDSNNPEWGIGTIRSGDPLPYIPSFQATFSVGSEYRRWEQEFLFQYTSAVYDQATEFNRLDANTTVSRTQIPAYGIIDWNGKFRYSKTGHVFAKADNLLGKRYAVSWRPFGLRPGKPQSIMVGVEQIF